MKISLEFKNVSMTLFNEGGLYFQQEVGPTGQAFLPPGFPKDARYMIKEELPRGKLRFFEGRLSSRNVNADSFPKINL